MSRRLLEFHFDYLSPYAYLAWLELKRLLGRDIELALRPVALGALLKHWGQLGPAEIPPKALFTFKDCLRRAARLGHGLRAPAYHPFNPLTALRASLPEVAGAAQHTVIDALFRAGWADGRDLGSRESIVEILNEKGLDGAALVQRTEDPEVKARLKSTVELAISRGVFGVPTVLVDDELFWGADQIEAIEHYLDGSDPLARLSLAELAPKGASAQRKR